MEFKEMRGDIPVFTVDTPPPSLEDYEFEEYPVDDTSLYVGLSGDYVRFFAYSGPSSGYGGHTFEITMENGETRELIGPWSSRESVINGYTPVQTMEIIVEYEGKSGTTLQEYTHVLASSVMVALVGSGFAVDHRQFLGKTDEWLYVVQRIRFEYKGSMDGRPMVVTRDGHYVELTDMGVTMPLPYSIEEFVQKIQNWKKGELIQHVFPDASVDIREFIMSGSAWDERFGEAQDNLGDNQ